jgi:triosephosphate isomerase
LNRKYRKTIIAGNWKMNTLPSEVKSLFAAVKASCGRAAWCRMVLCVPYTHIQQAVKATRDCRISVGAQNLHQSPHGAYTGEVSAPMLKDLGVKYVIVGHSERRQYYGETDVSVREKTLAALEAGLRPIVCVGETLQQRDLGVTNELVTLQVATLLAALDSHSVRKVVFAYEPVWAIGTGRTATAEQAQEVCALIRALLRKSFGTVVARSVPILYGGSMNASNAKELLAMGDVDGGLIGGASLKPEEYAEIVRAANQ